jgi:hypothetical protein
VSTWWILVERRERQQQEKDKEKQHARSNRIASHPVSSRANSAFCNHPPCVCVLHEFRFEPMQQTYSMGACSNRNQKHTKKKTRSLWSNHKRVHIDARIETTFLVGWSSVPVSTFPQKESLKSLIVGASENALGRLWLGERRERHGETPTRLANDLTGYITSRAPCDVFSVMCFSVP